jgi:hypothetical protein
MKLEIIRLPMLLYLEHVTDTEFQSKDDVKSFD